MPYFFYALYYSAPSITDLYGCKRCLVCIQQRSMNIEQGNACGCYWDALEVYVKPKYVKMSSVCVKCVHHRRSTYIICVVMVLCTVVHHMAYGCY